MCDGAAADFSEPHKIALISPESNLLQTMFTTAFLTYLFRLLLQWCAELMYVCEGNH